EGEDEVAEPHDCVFDPASGERGEKAEHDSEDEPDADRNDADENRNARAHQELRRDVAPEVVRSEPMRQRRRGEFVGNVDRGGRIRRPDEGDRSRKQKHQRQNRPRPEAETDARAPRASSAHAAGPRSRGSMAAQARSTTKFNAITIIAVSITPFSTTRVSRLEIDCSIRRPSPGRTNTFSTTIAPAIRLANCSPMMVRIGVSALGSAWRQSAARRDTPLARAVRMKSSFSASMSADRATRVRIAACARPSAIAGRISAVSARPKPALQPGKPPAGTMRQCTAKASTSRIANQKLGTA